MTTPPRLLLAEDLPQILTLGQEAFGDFPAGYVMPTPEDPPLPGRHAWGSFEGERLVAKAVRREFDSWFHGAQVATNAIAGVAVSAEHRGAGLLDDVMAAALDHGLRDRSEVISTLFPTAPGIYRRYGYELISSYDTVEIATSRLHAIKPAESTRTRRAVAADIHDIRRVYAAWSSAQNGPLTRTGVSFSADAEDYLSSYTAVTLAVQDDEVVGYAAWNRGSGYDASSTLDVSDLIALTPDATRALWRMIGSFATVTGKVHLTTSGRDLARLALPFDGWQVVDSHPYMLRVHDVAGAFTGLRLPALQAGPHQLDFEVRGDLLGTTDGRWTLSAEDGLSTCSAGGAGGPVFTPRGLALAYAGAASCADLRMAGLLTGGSHDTDEQWDSLFPRRELHIRNYF